MDFTILGGVVGALLLAIPAIGAYFQASTRRTRRENRKLRALVQEGDVHMFLLEREGWTRHGERPPPRPKVLQGVSADDDVDTDTAPARRDGEGESSAQPRRRHAAVEE